MDYEKRAFIAASEQVLTETLPEDYDAENWVSKEGESIDEWLVSHVWKHYKQRDAEWLWGQIESIACTIKEFHSAEVSLAIQTLGIKVAGSTNF